jgi:hypothetical protein
MKGKKKNPWFEHLNKTRKMKQHKGKSLKECMKIAKKTYKK